MNLLDIFEGREPHQQAIDRLEARRIEDLEAQMDDLAGRAQEATDPAHKSALVKQFQKCKQERDSYYKLREDGIGQDIVNKTEKMARATPPTPAGKVASTVKHAARWLAGKGGPGKEGPTYESVDEDDEDDTSPVAGAITRRILMQRSDLLSKYGPQLVTAAIDNVADYVGDVEEIGSSDVSGWVAEVERMLKQNPPEAFAENQLNEVGVASDKKFTPLGKYGTYDLYVTKQKFNNIAFIAVGLHQRTKAEIKVTAPTQEEAVSKLKDRINKDVSTATRVSDTKATLDFNRDFKRDVLELSDLPFYVKVIPGPKLVIAGREMENNPQALTSQGFKVSHPRSTGGLPGADLPPRDAIAADLIANGRYVLKNETIAPNGARVFDMDFDSQVQAKNDWQQLNVPGVTVATKRAAPAPAMTAENRQKKNSEVVESDAIASEEWTVSIDGRPWKTFTNAPQAMKAAQTIERKYGKKATVASTQVEISRAYNDGQADAWFRRRFNPQYEEGTKDYQDYSDGYYNKRYTAEGSMKEIDIELQDYHEMTPQQFKAAYGQDRDRWYAANRQVIRDKEVARRKSDMSEGATVAYVVRYFDTKTGDRGESTVSALTREEAQDKIVELMHERGYDVVVTGVRSLGSEHDLDETDSRDAVGDKVDKDTIRKMAELRKRIADAEKRDKEHEYNNRINTSKMDEEVDAIEENLKKWFKEKWVRFGPDGKIRGACARGSESEGKPKCLPQSKAHALGKKGRASSAAKKRREDPNPERRGAAKNVATRVKEAELDEACWKGYHKEGNKELFGKTVPNCVKNESVAEGHESCPECGGAMYPDTMINEKQDACYYKVKSRYKVWPSAYASGALVQCRKKGAANWGNKSESVDQELDEKWSQKYKSSINCSNPKGFSQRAHCAGRKKNEDIYMENNEARDAVESAIIRRIMVAHKDLLMKFGPQKVMDAAQAVADEHADVEEIGTSDVSAYVREVERYLAMNY